MPTTEPAIDLAFSLFSQEKLRFLWSLGKRRVVHNLWTGGYVPRALDGTVIPVHNIQAVLDSGLAFAQDGYIVVDDRRGSGEGAYHVDMARVALSDVHWRALERAWIDVEVDNPAFNGTTFPTVRAGVERVVQLGKTREIYTRQPFWALIGASPDFGDCGFWLADYDGNPDPYVGFAPFPSCSLANYRGKQHTNTSDADGIQVDLDTFIVQEDVMADDELRRWEKAAGIFEHAASDVEQWGQVVDANVRGALLYLVGPGQQTVPKTFKQAHGALTYAAAQAHQMTPANEGAKQIIRALAAGATVP